MATEARTLYIFSFIFGFTAGIFLSSFVFILPIISLLIFIIGLSVLVVERPLHREAMIVSILIISFSLGALRYSIKDFHEIVLPDSIGIVSNEPENRDNFRRFVLLSDNGERALVNAPLYSIVQYGDRVMVSGDWERPGVIEDFDYGKYLAKDDIYWIMNFAEVEIISSGHGNPIKSALFRVKSSFTNHIKEILAEPHVSLLSGLIISGREAMPKDILDEFKRAEVVHIVVLSGFNIVIIAEFMKKIFQGALLFGRVTVWPHAPALLSALGVILFVIMTGAEATVVRAAIMALIAVVAGLSHRAYSAWRALVFAGFIMVLHNPKILVFDPSFQLSFLATLGLIFLCRPIEQRLKWITEKFKIRETVSQTLAAQTTVLPLLAYSTGFVSPLFLPANILILPIVPWAMLIGFMATAASYLSSFIALPLTFASHLALSWILFVAHFIGGLA